MLGEVFGAVFLARRVHFGVQPVECHGSIIEQERGPFLIPAGVVHPVGVHDIPARPQDWQHAAEVRQIVPQFDEPHQIELAQDFGDKVDRRLSAFHLAEFADIPNRDINGLIELRRRNFGVVSLLLLRASLMQM